MPVSRRRKKTKKKKKPVIQEYNNRYSNSNLDAKKLLKKRALESGFGMDFKFGKHKHSVSGLVLEFGQDIIDMCECKNDYLKFIPFIIICWNMGNFDEEERASMQIELEKETGLSEFEEMTEPLVERKRLFYNQYKYYIADYEITFPEDENINLTVSSIDLAE